MDLIIQHGELVSAEGRQRADIHCREERIMAIAPDLPVPPGAETLDAEGCLVLPGLIDPHVHFYLPTGSGFGSDDYQSGTQAALMGGTTCVLDFVTPLQQERPLAAWKTWHAESAGRAACDYAFHLSVTRFDEQNERELRELVAAGAPSFKLFLAYQGSLGISDAELYGALSLAGELDIPAIGHCENAAVIACRQQELLRQGRCSPRWHACSRPPRVEAMGTHHFLAFAELAGARPYIAHLSCQEALQEVLQARGRGVPAAAEVVIQHLLLDAQLADGDDPEYARFIMSPPLRDKHQQEHLWTALADGCIDTVATDHAPFHLQHRKLPAAYDFTRIPNGLGAVEHRLTLLYSYGVNRGRISWERLVDLTSSSPARCFDLYPRKGVLAPGSDADIVVFNPHWRGTISARTHAMNLDYDPFEGWVIDGRAEAVLVRGRMQVRQGRFVGDPGWGRFQCRQREKGR